MFFVGEVEVAVHLRSFRNISVKQPCELSLRLSVSHVDQFEGRIAAIPIELQKCSLVGGVRRTDISEEYSRSVLDKGGYKSKCICDELAGLDDLCTFRTRVNIYPGDRLKDMQFTLEFVLEQAKTTFMLARVPAEIGKCAVEIPYKSAQCIQPFFDVFSFGSAVDGTVYMRLLSMQFVNNFEVLQGLVLKQSERMRLSHIQQQEPLMLPMHFESFEEFLNFTTNDCSRQEVQRFYDCYVEGLKHELLELKKLATEYLNSLENKEEVTILNMSLVKKLSALMPEPTHLKRKERKSIFAGRDSKQRLLSDSNQQTASQSSLSLKASLYLPTNKISEFRLSLQALSECITKDLQELKKLIEELWKEFIRFVVLYPNHTYYAQLRKKHAKSERNECLLRNCSTEGAKAKQSPSKCPTQLIFNSKDDLNRLLHPVYPPEGIHVIVLVHGYQAYSSDMERIANYLRLVNPHIIVLCSSSNEGSCNDKIELMGQRLAVEVKNFVNSLTGKISISFVCHSMGGLVARAALPYLSFYKGCMQSFVSVCSPHTGYVFHTSMLVKTGLWVINKMKNSQCLKQMCCEDTLEPSSKKHFLQQLAESDGLQWFKNVVLMASREDEYVSYSSARIEKDPQCSGNSQEAVAYRSMLEALQEKLAHVNLSRIRVQFCKSETNFNSFIGRTAHIQLLTDRESIRLFANVLGELFSSGQ